MCNIVQGEILLKIYFYKIKCFLTLTQCTTLYLGTYYTDSYIFCSENVLSAHYEYYTLSHQMHVYIYMYNISALSENI